MLGFNRYTHQFKAMLLCQEERAAVKGKNFKLAEKIARIHQRKCDSKIHHLSKKIRRFVRKHGIVCLPDIKARNDLEFKKFEYELKAQRYRISDKIKKVDKTIKLEANNPELVTLKNDLQSKLEARIRPDYTEKELDGFRKSLEQLHKLENDYFQLEAFLEYTGPELENLAFEFNLDFGIESKSKELRSRLQSERSNTKNVEVKLANLEAVEQVSPTLAKKISHIKMTKYSSKAQRLSSQIESVKDKGLDDFCVQHYIDKKKKAENKNDGYRNKMKGYSRKGEKNSVIVLRNLNTETLIRNLIRNFSPESLMRSRSTESLIRNLSTESFV